MAGLRIGIACPGLGRIRRGFETFAEELFRELRSEGTVEAVLFKGAGEPALSEIPLWNLPRNSPIWRLSLGSVDPYAGEQITFALSLARRLKADPVDLIHVSDCQVASLLAHLMSRGRNRPRIVFSNGGPMSPPDYRGFDFIHQVNSSEFERALSYGIKSERMKVLPYGVDVQKYNKGARETFRSRMGIPQGAFVLLTVGAHGTHKRLDFLVRQMQGLGENAHLLVLGENAGPDSESLMKRSRDSLGHRVLFASLPHGEMPDAYSSADLYVHTALYEGFGLVFLEALASGLPVVHHDERNMNWIVGDGGLAVDMSDPTALSGAIRGLMSDSIRLEGLSVQARRRAEDGFSWRFLLPKYLEMYSQALLLPPAS